MRRWLRGLLLLALMAGCAPLPPVPPSASVEPDTGRTYNLRHDGIVR